MANDSERAIEPRMERLLTAARGVRGAAGQDDAARQTAEDALGRERTSLIAGLRSDPALARAVLARLLESPADDARALAVVLRHVPDPWLGSRLAEHARTAKDAHVRQAAIVALEGRDGAVWAAPVTRAFAADAAPEVRTEAARVLSRSLRDRVHAAHHESVRDALMAGLNDPDARQRMRAAEAFAIDRDAPPAVRARLTEMSTADADLKARAAASSAIRALSR